MQYSKKVMEMFTNPKNVGEIKDADGVGEVGNPSCLLPEEKIHTNFMNEKIKNLKVNQRVLTHTGKPEKIINTSDRYFDGKIVNIKNKLGVVSLTSEHILLVIKKPTSHKFSRTKNKKKLIPAWYHAADVEKGDIALYPITNKQKKHKFIEIKIPESKWDFKSKKIPGKIRLTAPLLRLFGYYLAEGSVRNQPSKSYITFTLHIKEKDIVEDIKKTIKSLFDIEIKVKEIPERKTTRIDVYSAKLARLFKILFGTGAESKTIPEFIMNLPIENQKALIYGLWKGDGYININRQGARAGYSTISYQLAQQIKTLLLRQRIVPSIYVDKERIRKGVKHRVAYRIHVGQRDSLIKLCKIFKIDYIPKSYASLDSWFDENYMYTPITAVNTPHYKGKVYNLEVENAHSFTSEAFCLHNCGDMMTVYIKVGKAASGKNKGKEIIKDIKFKTYGCAAAIATSSMITELAKGKTIAEAEQITRKDVADELGGLPPIKLHCSNLAADALRAAIQDYKKKK